MAAGEDSGKRWLEIDRFRSRADGKSEFVRARIPWNDVIPLDEQGDEAARLTATFASPTVKFVQLPAGLSQGDHPAPEPQIVLVLRGRLEVETSGDRVAKSWGAGEFFIAGDHDGIGHSTRVLGDEPVLLMFVPLGAQDPDAWTVG